MDFRIAPATSTADLSDVRALFIAYTAGLGIDLAFQGFARELEHLPGKYAPPGGALLLARDDDGVAIGCIAIRPLEAPLICEMKRLYVAPAGRGRHLGRALVDAAIAAAAEAGYQDIRLDTLPEMDAARAIYQAAGFTPISAYYDTPLAGTIFLAKSLNA